MAPISLDFQIQSDADANLHRQIISPVLAQNPVLKKSLSTDAALREMVGACLQQILPNANAVSSGVATSEHLHQARIGLRRLRSVLQVFGDWSTESEPSWRSRLGDLFIQLGSTRDHDMLEASVLPELRMANAPLTDLPLDEHHDISADVLSSPACTELFRELITFSQGSDSSSRASPRKQKGMLRRQAKSRFEHLYRQLLRDTKAYTHFNEVDRHRVRKRLKRLRYCVELVSSVYPPKKVNRFLERLRPAQTLLGQYNDLMVADQVFKRQLEFDPRAWFAVGWVAARRTQLLLDTSRTFASLTRAPKFW